ncbi:MAG: hypothetical protein Salg2KO_20620 [Salibacteraceae bacterium]
MLLLSADLMAQIPFSPGAQVNSYTDTRVRGYHFVAPVSFNICQLYVPNTMNNNMWHVEVVRFTNSAPPAFPATTNAFTSLFYANNVTGNNPITCNIPVSNGDIIGIYGSRSTTVPTQMANSYDSPNFVTTILGQNATLSRSGMQFPLNNQQMHDIWSEVNYNTGRIVGFHSCCPDPPAPIIQAAPTQICASDTFTYSIIPYNYPVSLQWSGGQTGTVVSANQDSSTVGIIFNGNVVNDTVCLTITDTCTSRDTCIAVVVNPPVADAGPDESICSTTYQLQGNNGLGAWSVLNGAGTFANANQYNTTVSGLAPGVNSFRWSVGNAQCDTVTDDVNITVKPIPVAAMNFTDGCDQNGIQFTSTSYALGGTIIDWDWDVDGDGVIDYSTNTFTHTYATHGTYQCTLVVEANLGCLDTVVETVTVYPNPNVDFTYDPDCEGSPMSFFDQTNIASGSLSSWDWDFGDGTANGAAQDPVHIYAKDSVYLVTLTVTSNLGCTTSYSDSVEVFSIPIVDFVAPNTCRNDTVIFTDTSESTQGAINYWEWDFGDNSGVVYDQHTSHMYGSPNTYNVKLIVATDKGCTNTVVKPLDIYPVPVPNFSQVGECERQRVRLRDSSIMNPMFGSYLVQWDWTFGDGNVASNEQVGNFYQKPGYYTVSQTPYSNYGCHTTEETEILIRPKPRGNTLILNDHICAANSIQFRDETYFDYTYDTTGVVDWYWSFGDGQTSTERHPENIYAQGGKYPVLMIVETEYGCIDSVHSTAVVNHNPIASFIADTLEGCSPHCVTFIDQSQYADTSRMTYRWRMGDGNLMSDVNPTYCYRIEDGQNYYEYEVELKVTSPDGCSDSARLGDMVRVHSNPYADFDFGSLSYSILDPVVEYINYSQGGDSWLWHFGDSSSSTKQYPKPHEYIEPGDYEVVLETESDFGCKSSISKVVSIAYHQTLFIPTSFSPNGDGINDFFEVKGEDLEFVKLWIYDRWGHEVFYGENEDARWDGLSNGFIMPIGSYAYTLEYKQTNRIKKSAHGNFVLTRTVKQ